MMKLDSRLAAFLAGLLLGSGLIVSGMSQPAKVLGFLDVTGAWDPSLAFVMAGALAVAFPAFAWTRRHRCTVSGGPVALPTGKGIDRRLVAGSLVFGVGWGLSGLCPGPALVSLGFGSLPGLAFVIAMILGQRLVPGER